jgi:hypothetical protein
MRHTICHEDVEMVAGQFIAKDALRWEDEKITISWNFDFQQPPIGYASDFQREDDGAITAEIDLFGDMVLPKGYTFSIYMVDADYHRWKDILWITSALIKGVAIVPDYFYPLQKEAENGAQEEAPVSQATNS